MPCRVFPSLRQKGCIGKGIEGRLNSFGFTAQVFLSLDPFLASACLCGGGVSPRTTKRLLCQSEGRRRSRCPPESRC